MDNSPESVLEQLIVVQCQAGDAHAFEALATRYDGRLRYYLHSLLGSDSSIEDSVQDVWLAVVRGIGRLRSPATFRSWVYRIARNRAYSDMRRTGRCPKEEPATNGLPEGVEPEFSAEDAAAVHECLGRLRLDHRDILVLRFMEDMSYSEIADTVGCAVGTVRSRLHYAKVAMKRELERTRHG